MDKPILYDITGKPLVNKNSRNSLREAVQKGDLQAVRYELSLGQQIDPSPLREKTLLEIAAERGDLAIVRELIKAGVDLNRGFDYPPLYAAVSHSHIEVVRALISVGAEIDSPVDEDGDTILLEAIEQDNLEIVKLLVEAGADVNFWGEVGTPLLVALEGRHQKIFEFLYDFVTDCEILRVADEQLHQLSKVTQVTSDSEQKRVEDFILSASKGDLKSFQAILKTKIDVNSTDSEGSTALIEAAYFGNISIVEILLKKGASPNLFSKNHDGTPRQTPLMSAAVSRSPHRLNVIKKLIQAGADVNAKGMNDFTALMYVLYYGIPQDREDVVKYLISVGADVNAIDSSGQSVLFHARQNYLETIIPLLQNR